MGSDKVEHQTEGTRGHFGEQKEGAVSVNNGTRTITVNTATYATQVAVNVRSVFTDLDDLTELRIRTAAVGETAAGNWVTLRSTEGSEKTDSQHFHVYTTNDNGWVTSGNHMPAYFVVGSPAAGDNRRIEVDGTYKSEGFSFFVTINRAAAE